MYAPTVYIEGGSLSHVPPCYLPQYFFFTSFLSLMFLFLVLVIVNPAVEGVGYSLSNIVLKCAVRGCASFSGLGSWLHLRSHRIFSLWLQLWSHKDFFGMTVPMEHELQCMFVAMGFKTLSTAYAV